MIAAEVLREFPIDDRGQIARKPDSMANRWTESVALPGPELLQDAGDRSRAELLDLAAANYAGFLRRHAQCSDGGEWDLRQGLLTAAGPRDLPVAPFNAALRVENVPAQEAVELALQWFGARQRGFCFGIASHRDADLESVCQKRGFFLCSEVPVMALVPSQSCPPSTEDLELERVATARGVRDFARVASAAYAGSGTPPSVVEASFARTDVAPTSRTQLLLARSESRTIGCAMLLPSGSTFGIYWLGILPEFRGFGYADRLGRVLVRHAISLGATALVLQALPAAEKLYRRLGFIEISRLRSYYRCWNRRPARAKIKSSNH